MIQSMASFGEVLEHENNEVQNSGTINLNSTLSQLSLSDREIS